MRKLLLLCLLMPVMGLAQEKNVVTTNRVFPKVDKVMEFEKALAAHAQKYHTGDFKWRVFTIESGPDAGGYLIVEGPNTWEGLDSRGDISLEHNADWNKNVTPFLTDRGSSGYGEFDADLSSVKLTDYAEKVSLFHIDIKPGKRPVVVELIKKLKKAWLLGDESVAVYENVSSGSTGFTLSTRLKAGLKELGDGFRKSIKERYEQANGEGTWQTYLDNFADAVEKRWSELIFYKASLSSK